MPYTCECGQRFDLVAALDQLPSDRMGSSGMFCPACISCGQSMEVRLKNGGYDVGCSYFGGSMHFEVMKRVSVKGLKITAFDPDDSDVAIGIRHWHFGIRLPATARYVVFQQAFAAGKHLEHLDFARWDVTFTGIHRNGMPLSHSPDTMIEAGDILTFSGPSPALTRIWLYMNDGKTGKKGSRGSFE
jgi:hypothetical protein